MQGNNSEKANVWAIIPSRYASTRFPGKPLALIAGKPMVQHVYERATRTPSLTRVMVATEDERIADAVREFGGSAIMTGDGHATGTDRVAEAVTIASKEFGEPDLVMNIQGDEPMINPRDLENLVQGFINTSHAKLGTLIYRIRDEADRNDPNVVKVTLDRFNRAIYFSRSPIPYFREQTGNLGWRHMGIYLFKKDFLFEFAKLPLTELATAEQLEQLRALEFGHSIHCFEANYLTIGVDVPDDVPKAEKLITTNQGY